MKFFTLFIGLALIGCSSGSKVNDSKRRYNSKVFKHKFDDVWRAAQIALQQYPIRVNNTDRGLIETDFVREGEIWSPPDHRSTSTIKYNLTLRAIKGEIQSKPAIKVTITKKGKKYKNFFQGSSEVKGNNLEELMLLYRIKRELLIEHALNKLQKKQ